MSNEAKEIAVTVDKNPFALSGRREPSGGMMAVASSRQAQEVQAMAAIAKRFPRDQESAYTRIMVSCQRKGLAEGALYSYPRGGQQITGPSIRLAEALAQNWGNLDFGIVELEQKDGESTVMSYCVDLETNTRQTKIFQVAHERKANGVIKKLDDPRDVYELVSNMGARRLRACILGVIPGDIIEAAVDQCEKTLKGGKEPLIDRIRVMATKFKEDFNVTTEMLEKRLLHKLDAVNEQEMVALRKIYVSIKDGFTKREDWFELVDKVEKPEGLSSSTPEQQQPGQSNTAAAQATATVPNETLGEKSEDPKIDWRAKFSEAVSSKNVRGDAVLAYLKAKALIHRDTPMEDLFSKIKPSLAKRYAENIDGLIQEMSTWAQQAATQPPTVLDASGKVVEPTRLQLVEQIRQKMMDAAVAEADLLGVLYARGTVPQGSLLTAVPSDMLKAILSDWGAILVETEQN